MLHNLVKIGVDKFIIEKYRPAGKLRWISLKDGRKLCFFTSIGGYQYIAEISGKDNNVNIYRHSDCYEFVLK